MKAYELLADRENWVKSAFFTPKRNPRFEMALDKHEGDQVVFRKLFTQEQITIPRDQIAQSIRCCVSGAIHICYPESHTRSEVFKTLEHSIPPLELTSESSVIRWNDDPKTTHEQVLSVLKELDI